MALSTAYLQTTKNLDAILNSIVNAKAPDRFTYKFLEDLGFKSSNDRLYISVFKALGLLDDNSAPTPLYLRLIDQTETDKVLAEGIQAAYEDLFALRKDAYNLTLDEVKGKMRTLTEGQKSDNVINYMASTFLALCERADWSTPKKSDSNNSEDNSAVIEQASSMVRANSNQPARSTNFHYNIQIHLPETTNMAVYDAIFQSMAKHLGI